jgi:hypothetical protein
MSGNQVATYQPSRSIPNHRLPPRTRRILVPRLETRAPVHPIRGSVLHADGAQDRGEVAGAAVGVGVPRVDYRGAEAVCFGEEGVFGSEGGGRHFGPWLVVVVVGGGREVVVGCGKEDCVGVRCRCGGGGSCVDG